MVIGATSASRYAWGDEIDPDEALWTAWLLVVAWAIIDAVFVVVASIWTQGRERLAARRAGRAPAPLRLTGEVWFGALATATMMVLVALPALTPFWFPGSAVAELWISNAVAVATLFWLGWFWARWTDFPRWAWGLGIASIGLVAVGVTLLLGVA